MRREEGEDEGEEGGEERGEEREERKRGGRKERVGKRRK